MTRATPRAPKTPQAPQGDATDPVPDPLADLREPDDLGPVHAGDPEPAEDEAVAPVALVTQDDWDEARRRAIVAMHADTTTLGFLHKGGACGCHYIAGVILQAVLPVEPEALTCDGSCGDPEPHALHTEPAP